MSKLRKNLIYNILYQILVLVLPLVTVPYVSRVLGANGVGIYSYTYSIVYYFMLIALLGINNYGNRAIAQSRDNKNDLSKKFISIYVIQLIMSFVMIILYLAYIFLFCQEYKIIALIQTIYLVSSMLDINWFFFGLEEFKITVTRSTLLKIVSLIFIFLFVKTPNQVWIYTLILATSTLLSQLLLWSFLFNRINFVKVGLKDIVVHIKPCLILFIPVIAISLYRVMDKIMLGIMGAVIEVGYYEQAEKIISIPTGIITAIGTVMMPRISNLVVKGQDEEAKKYISKSVKLMMFMAFPICFGIISIASDFIPIFLGDNFRKSIVLIYYLSITILFLSFANVIRTQYLIPKEKDNIYIGSVLLGALVNLIANFLLIPKLHSIGAAIGTVLAEFFVMLYQTMAVRKDLPILEYFKCILEFFIKSIIMFIIILLIKRLELSVIIKIIIQIFVGCITYFVLNIKYINSIISIKDFLKKVKGRKLQEKGN